jgi:hypothetical protein
VISSRTTGLQTTDWETTEWKNTKVGSAYLPEKQRGKAGGETVVHRKLQHSVADDVETEPKLRPIDNNYAPDLSRKRRSLHTDNVEALQDCRNCLKDGLEDIRLVGNLKDDWREIGILGYALAFETLRATLLILLAIVRLGAD